MNSSRVAFSTTTVRCLISPVLSFCISHVLPSNTVGQLRPEPSSLISQSVRNAWLTSQPSSSSAEIYELIISVACNTAAVGMGILLKYLELKLLLWHEGNRLGVRLGRPQLLDSLGLHLAHGNPCRAGYLEVKFHTGRILVWPSLISYSISSMRSAPGIKSDGPQGHIMISGPPVNCCC